jgi:hypothetical protein
MTLSGYIISEMENFRYIGLFVQKDAGFGLDIKHRIKCD